jgi:hypothetical protein
MPKKPATKRPSNRSTRQTGRSRSGSKTQQGRQKQSESQVQRSEANMDMMEEE